jgi:hypothetical protein
LAEFSAFNEGILKKYPRRVNRFDLLTRQTAAAGPCGLSRLSPIDDAGAPAQKAHDGAWNFMI